MPCSCLKETFALSTIACSVWLAVQLPVIQHIDQPKPVETEREPRACGKHIHLWVRHDAQWSCSSVSCTCPRRFLH